MTSEKPGIAERYARASQSSDLRCKAAAQLTEVRGIFAPADAHPPIKPAPA